jgi:hypothetical protein
MQRRLFFGGFKVQRRLFKLGGSNFRGFFLPIQRHFNTYSLHLTQCCEKFTIWTKERKKSTVYIRKNTIIFIFYSVLNHMYSTD